MHGPCRSEGLRRQSPLEGETLVFRGEFPARHPVRANEDRRGRRGSSSCEQTTTSSPRAGRAIGRSLGAFYQGAQRAFRKARDSIPVTSRRRRRSRHALSHGAPRSARRASPRGACRWERRSSSSEQKRARPFARCSSSGRAWSRAAPSGLSGPRGARPSRRPRCSRRCDAPGSSTPRWSRSRRRTRRTRR